MSRARARVLGRMRGPINMRDLSEGVSGPGIDPRQWVSYATVDYGDNVITFDPDYGPLVQVTLQPTKIQVTCRVAMWVAGDGEGEYNPFVSGDEVLVAIPEGSERSDCAIIGRFTNSIDKFPMSGIAGQDPTKNAFAFRRQRTPFIHEVAGPYMVRQATTGALLSFDTAGVLTLKGGDGSALQMSADYFTYQSADGESLLQLDATNKRFTMRTGDAVLTLSDSGASPSVNAINTLDVLALGTLGNLPAEHVMTTEQCVNLIYQVLFQLGLQLPGPLFGAAVAGLASTLIGVALPIAASAPMTAGPQAALLPLLQAAIKAQPPKQTPVDPVNGQLAPGIACQGLAAG